MHFLKNGIGERVSHLPSKQKVRVRVPDAVLLPIGLTVMILAFHAGDPGSTPG